MPIATRKTALVTGASSGIGYELARCFAEDGHDLILVSRSEAELQAIAVEFADEHGISSTVIAKDLFRLDAAQELYDEVRTRNIEVNYLVNDAGQGVYGKFAETDLEQELKIIVLNVCAAVTLTKLFLRDMVARNEGRILQVASMVSKNPAPYAAVYSGTKAFLYNFSEAVAEELQGTQVTMTALRPGATDTDFFRKAGAIDMALVQERKLGAASKVARDGYAALMRGDREIVSGLPNKIQDAVGNLLPDKVVARRMRKAHEPRPPSRGHRTH